MNRRLAALDLFCQDGVDLSDQLSAGLDFLDIKLAAEESALLAKVGSAVRADEQIISLDLFPREGNLLAASQAIETQRLDNPHVSVIVP